MTKYIALKENNKRVNFICVRVDYDLGGYNMFTHEPKVRGYYITVYPVYRATRNGITSETFGAFSGTKYLLLEVKRKSAKAEAEAEKKAQQIEDTLIQWVCDKNEIEVEDVC